MGLFDFALYPGQRFNKVELSILDQNFNSISAYTKNKYRFDFRRIGDNICVGHYGVSFHEVTYSHIDINKDEFNSNYIRLISCSKYHIPNDKIYYHGLKDFYDSDYEDGPKIKVPKFSRNFSYIKMHESILKQKRENLCNLEDGLKLMKLIDYIRKK